jgi:hypothetical protein
MPKLVIKQDLPEPSAKEKLESVLRVFLPLLLFVIAAAAALSLYLSREPEIPEVVANGASLGLKLPLVYSRQEERLGVLGREFDGQEKAGLEGYDKHSSLVAKADAILQQLSEMDAMVAGLSITDEDKQALLTRHQYQKDYWESKRVFHNLRLSRFGGNAQEPAAANVEPPPSPVTEPEGKAAATADTAPKVDLPADFCPLFGPDAAACKPGADEKKP